MAVVIRQPRHRDLTRAKTSTLYVKEFTTSATPFIVGNEMQLTLVPSLLDAAWAVLYGFDDNRDNSRFAAEDDRDYASSVLRLELYPPTPCTPARDELRPRALAQWQPLA